MKIIKNLLIMLSVLIIMTGCTNSKNKALKSVEYLEDVKFYNIYLEFLNKDDSKYTYTYTFDENSQLVEREFSINGIPKNADFIKFDNDKIIRYYGDILKHDKIENSYYLNKWNKEELPITEENKEQYTFLDKNFYIEMIKNGLEYIKDGDGYVVVVSKDYIQKIVNQLQVEDYQVEKDVRINVTLENNNLSMMQMLYELDKFKNISIMFQTEFGEDNIEHLELPEV